MNDFYCSDCEIEFQVIHDHLSEPEYCPFCSTKLKYEDLEDEEWNDGEDGC